MNLATFCVYNWKWLQKTQTLPIRSISCKAPQAKNNLSPPLLVNLPTNRLPTRVKFHHFTVSANRTRKPAWTLKLHIHRQLSTYRGPARQGRAFATSAHQSSNSKRRPSRQAPTRFPCNSLNACLASWSATACHWWKADLAKSLLWLCRGIGGIAHQRPRAIIHWAASSQQRNATQQIRGYVSHLTLCAQRTTISRSCK